MKSTISWFFCYFLIILLARNTECRYRAKRLIAGSLPGPGELKYQVSIQAKGKSICGGAIIGEQHVLTAAHCVYYASNKTFATNLNISVVTGLFDLWDLREGGMGTTVVKAYVPQMYKDWILIPVGDIAVLKVKKNFKFGPNSLMAPVNVPPPVKLMDNGNIMEEYTGSATVSGYGWDEVRIVQETVMKERGKSSGKLHKANVEIVDYASCQSLFFTPIFQATQLCGRVREQPADVHQGICKYDSGGPLVQGDTIIGIVSYSRLGCDERTYPTIYTRVSSYSSFIHKAIIDKPKNSTLVGTWA